jgi:hypothetical protein
LNSCGVAYLQESETSGDHESSSPDNPQAAIPCLIVPCLFGLLGLTRDLGGSLAIYQKSAFETHGPSLIVFSEFLNLAGTGRTQQNKPAEVSANKETGYQCEDPSFALDKSQAASA